MHLPVEVFKRETDAVLRRVDESFDADSASLGRRIVSCNIKYKPLVPQTYQLQGGKVYFLGSSAYTFIILDMCVNVPAKQLAVCNTYVSSVKITSSEWATMTTAFWDATPCSLEAVYRRFWSVFCLQHQGDRPDEGSNTYLLLFFSVVRLSFEARKHTKHGTSYK
jgi:hypothetical protein